MSRRGLPVDARRDGRARPAPRCRRTRRARTSREAPYGVDGPGRAASTCSTPSTSTSPILYTTVGLLWEAEVEDPALSQAYTTAYNRWICEFCADEPRLVPTAHLSLTDPVAAAAELERAVGEGAKGGYVAPFTHDGRPLGHPDNDPVFAAAQDLDVPLAIHPTFEPQWTKGTRMGAWENVKQLRLLASVQASDGVRHQFTTLFDYGVFDAVPAAQGARARVGRRVDRLLARPHRRRLRPHVHRRAGAAASTSRATTSASGSGSAATPTSG